LKAPVGTKFLNLGTTTWNRHLFPGKLSFEQPFSTALADDMAHLKETEMVLSILPKKGWHKQKSQRGAGTPGSVP